jgi:formyltetrahydrofolate-dependent phosphoribosylglycinamide formyltransferase
MNEQDEPEPTRIAVFASGGGSNLEAILSHFDTLGARRGGSVVLVASDRSAARALERARARDIVAEHIARPSDGASLDELLHQHDVELIALAGYLRLVPLQVTRRFRGRIINIHPALLPAFGGPGMYGLRAHRAVLDSGVQVSGATAHFVNEAYDRGALIAQWPVPVLRHDTPELLAARVLQVEHLLYPRVVDAVARGVVTLGANDRAQHHGTISQGDPMFTLTSDEADSIAQSIDLALG